MTDTTTLSRITRQLSLRRRERLAHLASAIAVVLTVLAISSATAREVNPVSAWLISHGLETWAVLTPVGVAVVFAGIRVGLAVDPECDGWRGVLDRGVRGWAHAMSWLVPVALSLDALGNLVALGVAGVPSVWWAGYWSVVAGVVVLAVGLAFRWEIATVLSGVSERVAFGKGRSAGMALLVVLSVLSGIPFGGSYSPVSKVDAKVSNATLVGSSDMTGGSGNPLLGADVANDGAKIVVAENTNDWGREYDLTTKYDISSSSFVRETAISSSAQSIRYKSDGAMLYVGLNSGGIDQYSLSDSYNVSSKSLDGTSDTVIPTLNGMAFGDDGTKLVVVGNNGGPDYNPTIKSYDLSTPYDVTTATFNTNNTLSNVDTASGVDFNPDGSKMLISDSGTDDVYEYELSAAYDISTRSRVDTLSVGNDLTTAYDVDLTKDGTKMYIPDSTGSVYEYDVNLPGSTGYVVSGTVTGPDGETPIENATVTDGNGNSTTTNATGQYSLTLANGTYDLTASKGTFVDDTATITVDGAPVTQDFQLGVPLEGTVRDQNGEPVSNATVKMFGFNYTQLQLDGVCSTPTECREKASELREEIQDPTPQAWLDQNGSDFDLKGATDAGEKPFVEQATDDGAVYPLVHTADEWDVGGTGSIPFTRIQRNANPQLDNPDVVFDLDDRIAVSAWDASKSHTFSDPVSSDNPGYPVNETLVVKQLGAGGGVINEFTVQPKPAVVISPTVPFPTARTYNAGYLGTLDSGFYRVHPEDAPERSYVFAVAPGGNPEEIYADASEDLKTEAGSLEARAQTIEDLQQQNQLEVRTTTTDAKGRFSFNFDSTTVKSVTLSAYKAPAAMENVDANTTKQDIRVFFEGEVQSYKDRIREEYSLDVEDSTDPQQVNARLQELCGEATSDLGNVVNDVGGGYASAGTTTVSPPDQGVTVDVVGAEVPSYVGSADRLCYDTAFQEFVRSNNFSELATWAMQNISDLSNTEVEELFADTLRLAEGSEQVCREFASEWGVDPQGECDGGLSDDNGDGVLGDSGDPDGGGGGAAPVPIPDGDGNIPDDVDGPTTDDLREQVNTLQATLDQLRDSISSEEGDTEVGDGTISKCWAFDTDLSESQSLIKATWANGTTTTLTADSEFVTVDNPLGPGDESLCLTEFPLGDADPASITFTAHVAGPDGIGRQTSVIRNPAFSGQLPNLEAVRLSTSSPGPNDRVTAELIPEDTSEFGSVTNVTVTRAGQQVPTEAVQNRETAFTTNGSGTYRVKFTYSDVDGNSYVQVVKVGAGRVAHQLPPTVRYQTGPTGGFAVVSNGLESSVIDIEQSGASVDVQAVIAGGGDVPARVAVHTQGIDLATESTTTVRMVRGEQRQSVRQTTGVILHTIPLPEDATLYRDVGDESDPLPLDGENRYAIVSGNNSQTTVEYVTAGDGVGGVKSDTDPDWFEANWYSARLNYGWLPILHVTFWTGSGLTPAGAAAGGTVLPLGVGLLFARRWVR